VSSTVGYRESTFADAVAAMSVVTVEEFTAIEEPGVEALVGGANDALIPENGDVMLYGDGGSGKTTLAIDLAFHLAAGDDWLGMNVARPARVLLIENEGPRPLFRLKLRRKRDGWQGSPLDDRLLVLERPWAQFTFASPDERAALAQVITDHEIDVVIVGPLARSGMNEAGTLQEVREFLSLVADARARAQRRVAVVLIHHENKGGKVSGAWEGSGDTLLHVQGQGHGRTRLFVQKARWSSSLHGTALQLLWADGETFTVEETPELDDDTIAERILVAVDENPGGGWTKIEEATPGTSSQRRRNVRDRLLADGAIVNVVTQDGVKVALRECPERKKAHLYRADDPTIAHLRLGPDADGTQTASATAGIDQRHLRPASDLKEDADADAADFPPPNATEETL
jgi:AAA domain